MGQDSTEALALWLEEIEKQALAPEDALRLLPEGDQELQELARAALLLRSAPRVYPSDAFRAGARRRLIANLPPRQPRPVPHSPSMWAGILAALRQGAARLTLPAVRRPAVAWAVFLCFFLFLLLSGGAVYASGDALPGQLLYPVKGGVEQARLAVAFNDYQRGLLHLSYSQRRLVEVEQLLERGQSDKIAGPVHQYNRHNTALQQLIAAMLPTGEQEMLAARYRQSLFEQIVTLAQVEPQAPPQSRPALETAFSLAEQGRLTAQEALLAQAADPAASVALHLDFASDLVNLTAALTDMGQAERAPIFLTAYGSEIEAVLATINQMDEAEQLELAASLDAVLTIHKTVLTTVAEQAAAEAQPALEQALTVSNQGRERVRAIFEAREEGERPPFGPPEDAGPPDSPSRPDPADPPGQEGQPNESGPPDHVDPPGHGGRPDQSGPPDHVDPPERPEPPQQPVVPPVQPSARDNDAPPRDDIPPITPPANRP